MTAGLSVAGIEKVAFSPSTHSIGSAAQAARVHPKLEFPR
jgi:hypothetical protein